MAQRIKGASDDILKAEDELLSRSKNLMGFVPNAMQVLVRRPEILAGFSGLFGSIFGPGALVDASLKEMVAHIASRAAGCRYCQAHTAHIAEIFGASEEKVEALWTFDRSDLFSPAEKSALALAQAAALQPNAVTDEHFTELKKHFSDDQIVEILATIALYGFLNRFNDSLATELEEPAITFASDRLQDGGWTGGKHVT